jgi:DNA-directed RNA polymerase sigma subunit (sigma70/sigma32)
MEGSSMDISLLREEIEKLVLLEEVAERRQKMIEEQLALATKAGLSAEEIRNELGLSKESIRRLLDQKTPDLAERLGISRESAENLSESIG